MVGPMDISRLLVKAPPGLPGASVALAAGPVEFEVQPLLTSAGAAQAGGAAPSTWHVLTSSTPLDRASAWDACHQLMQDGLGVAGVGPPEFAEPDLPQQWLPRPAQEMATAMAQPCAASAPPDTRFPSEPNDPLWFKDAAHAQLTDALAALGASLQPGSVRIAHLDTGYDPDHATRPESLNTALQRNFVDADRPEDARDTSSGVLNTFGHGTGTLGILAGKTLPGGLAIGAAPFAEVVPIRVANSVVLFYNSAIASALQYVETLCSDPQTRVDVVTMSMGGLASQAWAEAVNRLYDAGVFIVTAAGNNWGNLPTRNIVFPARFNRVLAACGVMANAAPYADLGLDLMAGNYGPSSKMRTALSAFTPNLPWARFGCAETVDFNGSGTSCATPQIAAAAAIWIAANRAAWQQYPEGWMRVEAVRKVLFDSATAAGVGSVRLGKGELRVRDALQHGPPSAQDLRPEAPDAAAFPFLRLLTGLGLAASHAQQRMLELEALQLSQSAVVETLLPDPSVPPAERDPATIAQIKQALAEHPAASQRLRELLQDGLRRPSVPIASAVQVRTSVEALHLEHATDPKLPQPTGRRLRVYAYDPSLGTRLETLGINEATLEVPWEEVAPGPVGEYLEVIDVDPASQCCYAPVDLHRPHLLVQDGWAPSETNPQFHQQMVYAVASKTIQHFERALGRVALWAPRLIRDDKGKVQDEQYVQRLRVYPHVLRTANAFYSPERRALLLGYFTATAATSPEVLPGGLIFTALSSDIIAHETTHALLDGLHRRFREPSNRDVLAFHEAFADIVALFQHFSMPEALRQQIATTRGDLRTANLLAALAVQFGDATGLYGGLRNAIGQFNADGAWQPRQPRPTDYATAGEAHELGSVLVGAVFDAFLQIYSARTADLLRLATGGSGIVPDGAISVDLVDRLAQEASKAARHVLGICIRALDYCPPVDITFGEYLRALITADHDLVPEDRWSYRVAFVSAFAARGIYPADVRTLSPGSLIWESPPEPIRHVDHIVGQLSLDWDLGAEREHAYRASRLNAQRLHGWLTDPGQVSDRELQSLGLSRTEGPLTIGQVSGQLGRIEVHSVRPARRVGPDGQLLSDFIVEITQRFQPDVPGLEVFRGGCTLIIDRRLKEVRYLVRKRVDHAERFAAQQDFHLRSADELRANYSMETDRLEPFAFLHHGSRTP